MDLYKRALHIIYSLKFLQPTFELKHPLAYTDYATMSVRKIATNPNYGNNNNSLEFTVMAP